MSRARLALIAALALAGASVPGGAARAQKRPAAARHKVVLAPLTTLGAESSSAEVRAAQKLVASGLRALGTIDLVDHEELLARIKRARRPGLRACDGEARCLVELGRLLGADYTVYGEVGGLGTAQVVYLVVVDVAAAREIRNTVLELGGQRAPQEEARAAATRLLAPARYVGALAVATPVQGASIYVDGELVARTPSGPVRLPVGDHALRVTHPEFRDFVRFVEIPFDRKVEVAVELQPFAAVAGDIRRTGGAAPGPAGPADAAATPWYRRWYTIAGGAALVFVTAAVVVGLAVDGVDSDREKDLP
ncbi:MAG TPA: PEGA domain-containing protein [Kofleriaceae bacterium]|nr:PEGA domain-containing protein [Kofleriaceae bacterium]